MADMARPSRTAAKLRNWHTTVSPAVQSALAALAKSTKDNLTIAAGPAGTNVLSAITGGTLAAPVNGAYDSGTGVHAEIEAIEKVGSANWNQALTITTNLEPCPRCAAILGAFVAEYNWTVQAPNNAFAKNYTGAYYLPDSVFAVVVGRLSIGGPAALMPGEAAHFESQLKSFIKTFAIV